ncbi:iron transport inner membrane protein [Salmonella enterica subsp. arizonae]|nr:iron transport inner membrane protein [Salmonella enterica subsp. arizonae]
MFLTTLLEPFQFDFMVNALMVSVIVSIPCALLSVFLVLKGWALMGDAMSHAVFPGVVLAYIVGIPLAIGAFIAGLFCAIATGYLDENSRIKRDTVMGIVFSGCLAQVWCSMSLFNRKCIWITSCSAICWAYRWEISCKRRLLRWVLH